MLQTTTECGCTITLHDDGTDTRDYGESAPMHPTSCYVCAGDYSDAEADHAFILPCDAIGHRYCETDRTCYGCGEQAGDVTHALVMFDGQDTPPFLAYVEEGTWNGFTVAWATLTDLRAITLDGGVPLFDDTLDAYLSYVPGEGIYDVTNVQSVPLESRVINGATHYRMDGFTVTRVTRETDQERAYRAADFFTEARAARDDEAAREDVAAHETIVLAERFRLVDGYSESAPERARIIGTYGLGYLVRFLSDNTEALAFPSEIRTVR